MRTDYSRAADIIEDLQDQISTDVDNFPSLSLEFRSFSDSIFIRHPLSMTVENSLGTLVDFCTFLSTLMSNCFQIEVPLRGTISIGAIISHPRKPLSNARFLSGRAIWEIVTWEEKQNWSGIIFVPTEVVEEDNSSSLFYSRSSYYSLAITKLLENNLIMHHSIPCPEPEIREGTAGTELQEPRSLQAYALKWPVEDCDEIIGLINSVIPQLGSPSLIPKYENTRYFVGLCRGTGGEQE